MCSHPLAPLKIPVPHGLMALKIGDGGLCAYPPKKNEGGSHKSKVATSIP